MKPHRKPHVARKRFGQHFLSDNAIIGAIVDGIAPHPSDLMVEIGPGLAALTQPLVERLGYLTVVELDRDLAVRLRERPELDVVESDVLRVDFTALAQRMREARPQPSSEGNLAAVGTDARKIRVVGNLPYNISSPILFHLLEHVAVIEDQHFMLQKEVIDRMVAQPGNKDFGRLSVMLQWRYAMENFLFVPPESFDPPPRVDSAVVRMVPLSDPPAIDVKRFGEMVQVAFSQRRKLLRHTLGKWLEAQGFGGEFDLQRRAEEVSTKEFVELALAVG